MSKANTVIILDFETTGLSPDLGDRAIEIGAVCIENGVVVDHFQELMYPHKLISHFIEEYTGISNKMLADAAPCDEVMDRFANFLGGYNLVAHNASFDKRFLDAELNRIGRHYTGKFACSMLVSRRIYQDAPNHQLGGLIKYTNIPSSGTFHRALYDSEMTAKLWLNMLDKVRQDYGIINIKFDFLVKLSRTKKSKVIALMENVAQKNSLVK